MKWEGGEFLGEGRFFNLIPERFHFTKAATFAGEGAKLFYDRPATHA